MIVAAEAGGEETVGADLVILARGSVPESAALALLLRKADNMVIMWNIFDYKTGRVFEGKRFFSSTMQHEYDCKEERERLLFASARTQNMGKGDTVITDPFPHEWRLVPAGSIIKAFWVFACRNR